MPDDAADRLRCFEFGATVQAEMRFAEGTLESMERRATAPDETLDIQGVTYKSREGEVMRIHEDVFNDHLERAADAIEFASAQSGCGLPEGTLREVGDTFAKIKREVGESDYSLARLDLNTLRARLRHPGREF
jgi:hypothetical protein